MGRIDYTSINRKKQEFLKRSDIYKRYKSDLAKQIGASLADSFKNTLTNEIHSNPNLGVEAAASLSDISASSVYSKTDKIYGVDINFLGDMFRPSLLPDYYHGIDDISALLNNGYNARRTVFGYWERTNSYIESLKSRPGAHFAQNAVHTFDSANRNEKNGYRTIHINEKYK